MTHTVHPDPNTKPDTDPTTDPTTEPTGCRPIPPAPRRRITVIGTGYLGATHAACLAELGYEVLGVDTDQAKIDDLARGVLPFYEPGLPDLLAAHLASGRLRFGTSLREAAEFGDFHFVCVGTPQRPGAPAADVSQVVAAYRGLAPHVTADALIVGKSTVPVGTAANLQSMVDELAPPGLTIGVAWNPEFLREGFGIEDTIRPDRVVVGVTDPLQEKLLREVYAPLIDAGVPFLVTDPATAELVKVSANAFLATKVTFINAIAEVCDAAGADVATLARAIGLDARIGPEFLRAGIGYGGGCLPKDVRALIGRADELGVNSAVSLLRAVDSINMRQRSRLVSLAVEECGGDVLGRRIAVLGAAFKPSTDDVRDSPALNIAAQLQLRGAAVVVYDPQARETALAEFPTLRHAASAVAALDGVDLVLHLTEWPEFARLDPVELRGIVRRPCLIDGRNALDPQAWAGAGWRYRGIGRRVGAPRLAA